MENDVEIVHHVTLTTAMHDCMITHNEFFVYRSVALHCAVSSRNIPRNHQQ
jgi:hypothetical protein